MNCLRVCLLLFAVTVVVAVRAEETNTPSTASATSNAAPSGVTSNAAPSSIKIDGTTYEEVRWGRVTLSTVTIFHKTGVATIPLEKLPPDLQKQFGYDPQKVAAFQNEQQAKLAAFQKEQQAKNDRLRFEKEHVQELSGNVTSVVEGQGVILNNQHLLNSYFNAGGTDTSLVRLRYFFLACDTKNLVNDADVNCRAYRDGFYTYTSVMGASYKIDRYVYYDERTELPKP